MKQKDTKKRKNYIVSCIRPEFRFLWMILIVAAFFVFGFFLLRVFSSNGAVLGLSDIKTTAQLERFFATPDNSGRLYADTILDTGLKVSLTESSEKNFNLQIGGAYLESPSFTVSTYDKEYDIYLAPLEDNLLIVLFGNILAKGKPGLHTCESISIYNTPIGGTHLLVKDLGEKAPEFFSRSKNIYVVKGDYPESIIKPLLIALSVFLLLAAVFYALPRLSLLQRFSHFGRQVSAAAKAEGRSFREMCRRLDEYAKTADYRNGNQLLTGRYIIVKSPAPTFMNTGERMDLYAASESYGSPFIRSITMQKSDYPEEMNDIVLTANNGAYYRLTIHQPREEVARLVRQLGF